MLRLVKGRATMDAQMVARHLSAGAKAAGMPAAAMDNAMDKMRDAVGSWPAQREGKADSKTREDA